MNHSYLNSHLIKVYLQHTNENILNILKSELINIFNIFSGPSSIKQLLNHSFYIAFGSFVVIIMSLIELLTVFLFTFKLTVKCILRNLRWYLCCGHLCINFAIHLINPVIVMINIWSCLHNHVTSAQFVLYCSHILCTRQICHKPPHLPDFNAEFTNLFLVSAALFVANSFHTF